MSKINLLTTFKNHMNITFLILNTLYIHFTIVNGINNEKEFESSLNGVSIVKPKK